MPTEALRCTVDPREPGTDPRNMSRRDLIVSANARPLVGGQGLNLYHTVEALRHVFDLQVYCSSPFPGVPTTVIPASRVGEFIAKTRFIRRYSDWQQLITDAHFDHQVSQQLPPCKLFHGVTHQCMRSLAAAGGNRSFRVLDVITPHMEEYYFHQRRECSRFGIRPPSNRVFVNRILAEYEQADVIRVMSNYALQSFLERGFRADRIQVIPPPFDMTDFPAADFSGATFRVIFVGQIAPWKGFHHLIDAFNRRPLKDSELILWGGPGSRPVSRYLQQQQALNPAIQVKAVSIRDVGNEEVYAKANVFVLPSLSDGFGYVVAEAMASGLPVIVTKNTGAADLVRDGENGYIVAPGDVEALSDRLAHLASHPALVRQMGSQARQAVTALSFDRFRANYSAMIASSN
jgi:glycosyltransferase involved in cell wall biosynthesis